MSRDEVFIKVLYAAGITEYGVKHWNEAAVPRMNPNSV
jgi:hypothetical protein